MLTHLEISLTALIWSLELGNIKSLWKILIESQWITKILANSHPFYKIRWCRKATLQLITLKKYYQIDLYDSKALKAFEKNWDILEKLLKIWETSIHIEKWGFNSTIFCGSKTSHPDWRNVKWVKKDTIWSLEPENIKMFWKKLI